MIRDYCNRQTDLWFRELSENGGSIPFSFVYDGVRYEGFYPLTPWRHREDKSGFTAHLYFDPEEGRGVLLAFRQELCEESVLAVKLPDIGECELTDQDSGEKIAVSYGEAKIRFSSTRESRLIWLEVK